MGSIREIVSFLAGFIYNPLKLNMWTRQIMQFTDM